MTVIRRKRLEIQPQDRPAILSANLPVARGPFEEWTETVRITFFGEIVRLDVGSEALVLMAYEDLKTLFYAVDKLRTKEQINA